MNVLARSLRTVAKLRFRMLGLATIEDIPTERFKELAEQLVASGWRRTGEYKGFDAWIDYGHTLLRRHGVRLKLEWGVSQDHARQSRESHARTASV